MVIDGFPIYGQIGYNDNSLNGVTFLRSSYKDKKYLQKSAIEGNTVKSNLVI